MGFCIFTLCKLELSMQDINSKEDVKLLVNSFYKKVRANSKLNYIFDDLVKIDWEHHLPKMYSFWSTILLDEHSYSGNPMVKHIQLSKLTSMTSLEFSEWLKLFNQSVDGLFAGKNADEAKIRAANIARLMLYKIEQV